MMIRPYLRILDILGMMKRSQNFSKYNDDQRLYEPRYHDQTNKDEDINSNNLWNKAAS